ncbi:MAG: tetratricopeptide repeat protein [Rhodospirillales bacterium]
MTNAQNIEHLFQEAFDLHRNGNLATAERLYTEILQINSDHLNALVNIGAILIDLGRPAEAARYLEHAVQCTPDDTDALNNLGNALQKAGRPEEALDCFEKAYNGAPDNAAILSNLGRAFLRAGAYDRGLKFMGQAMAADPDNNALKVIDALALPMIPNSLDHLTAARKRIEQKIKALAGADIRLMDPANEVGATNFALSYHGEDDRHLQEQLAEIYLKACPELAYTAPHIDKPSSQDRIKIGFISAHLGSHTIGKLNKALLVGLDQTKFETHVFCPGSDKSGQDAIIDEIAAQVDHIYFPPPLLTNTRQCVADAELDLLYYLDIGMEPLTYFLAFSRLAKIQCVTVGHPVTTGIPTIDYFISSKWVEPENADDHYSEKLIKLDAFFADYQYPNFPKLTKGRSDFGLKDGATLYLCPQSLFKFHPSFDKILAGILKGDPKAEIILLAGPQKHWSELLESRFEISLSDATERVTILPRQSGADFIQLLSLADIFLDTPHFSGGNTSYEAFALGKAIVTMPGEFMRSRVTAGLYQMMEINGLIAKTSEDYIRIALYFGLDTGSREQIEARIRAARGTIFDTNSALRTHETFFLEAAGNREQ